RFIVRTHFLAKNLGETRSIWRSGIQLREEGQYAQLEVGSSGKTIEVRVTQKGKTLLDKIRNELDELQDQPGNVFVSPDGNHFAELTKLEGLKNEPDDQKVECVNGEYRPIGEFRPFLNRDQSQRFNKQERNIMDDFHKDKGKFSEVEKVRRLIIKGQMKNALAKMFQIASSSDLKDHISQLETRWNRFEKRRIMRLMSSSEERVEYNNLISDLLDLCKLLETDEDDSSDSSTIQPDKITPTPDLPKTQKDEIQSAKVYFSYSWGDSKEKGVSREEIVNQLYDSLTGNGFNIIRDKMNLEYGGFISEFMEDMGRGKLIVVFISSKYAKSPYCMFELFEIARNNRWDKEAF
ncbi:MAG: toll/interleukin-1 receptor domain-containing protein, partial [Bacteroidetes bacterium]|nr:toll/interleukin-1 receptor domain-containing protein [Bacteroidota bacterium]